MAMFARPRRLLVIAVVLLLPECGDPHDRADERRGTAAVPAGPEKGTPGALPVNAPADYQIGGDYEPAIAVEVVVRDWFSGSPLADGYSIC
jgi:hypothetical protein